MPRPGYEPKPLPSVDLALLPHELRAARARNMTVTVAVAAVALVGLWALFGEDTWAALQQGDSAPQETDGWPSETPRGYLITLWAGY